jgi:RNA-directed DNA polymerase
MGLSTRRPCIEYFSTSTALERWARRKFKTLYGCRTRSAEWLQKMQVAAPQLFCHWRVTGPTVG